MTTLSAWTWTGRAMVGGSTPLGFPACRSHSSPGPLETSAESFDEHVVVNARASLLLIAAFARQDLPDGGAIIALTSDATTGNLP